MVSLERVIKDCLKGLQEVEKQNIVETSSHAFDGSDVSFDEITHQFKKKVCKLSDDLRTMKQCLSDGDSSTLPTTEQCMQIVQQIAQEKQEVSKTIKNLESTTIASHGESILPDISSFKDLSNAFLVLLKVYGEIKSRSEGLQKKCEDLETKNARMMESLKQQKEEVENLLSKVERLELSKRESELAIERLQTEKKSLERQLEECSTRIRDCNDAYESLLVENNRFKTENETLSTYDREKTRLLQDNDQQRHNIEQLESERKRLNEELRLLKIVHGQISGMAKSLAQDLKVLKKEHKEREENLQIKLEALELTLEGKVCSPNLFPLVKFQGFE